MFNVLREFKTFKLHLKQLIAHFIRVGYENKKIHSFSKMYT